MRFEYDYSQWPLTDDKDNDEDGGNSEVYEKRLFPLTMPSDVWNGAFPSSSSLNGEWQTAQVTSPPPRTLDAATCSPYATLDRSLLVASYSGKANHSFDVGTVLAHGEEKETHLIYIFVITGLKLTTPPSHYTGPIPKDVAVFYFEATFNTLNGGTDRTRENDNGDDPMESSEPDNEIDNNQGEGSTVQESEDRVERESTRRGGRAERNNTYDSIGGCIGLVGDHFPLER